MVQAKVAGLANFHMSSSDVGARIVNLANDSTRFELIDVDAFGLDGDAARLAQRATPAAKSRARAKERKATLAHRLFAGSATLGLNRYLKSLQLPTVPHCDIVWEFLSVLVGPDGDVVHQEQPFP